ncbi:MAG TPA: DUF362 domain-containing protein [Armatimonadetes bacterium]|nr:DUF362 domain-containing protein [Armatimonadota bacterium]
MSEKLTRRDFLRKSATWGAIAWGLGEYGLPASAAPAGRAKVVLVKDPRVLRGGKIDPSVVEEMLRRGILALSGAKSVEEAWRSFFRPKDVVGLKLNCLFGPGASTHPEVTMAVVKGVQLAGVKPENILLWDRSDGDLRKSGYRLNRAGPGVQCYGTGGDYEPEVTRHRSFHGRLSKILTRKITALINVPILKDHRIAGITAAMKNHYGSFNNPNEHHDNNCDPYIADLNSLPVIQEKTRLIVCDALQPIPEGGPRFSPRFRWDYAGLLLSTDPVALDYCGWRIIEERRREVGLRPLKQVGRPPRQLASAAKLGLGTNDPHRIELVQI